MGGRHRRTGELPLQAFCTSRQAVENSMDGRVWPSMPCLRVDYSDIKIPLVITLKAMDSYEKEAGSSVAFATKKAK